MKKVSLLQHIKKYWQNSSNIVALIFLAIIIGLGFYFVDLTTKFSNDLNYTYTMRMPENNIQVNTTNDAIDNEPVTYPCTASGDHEHSSGILTANISGAKLIGWICTLSSHHICTSGPDGVWKECTWPPFPQIPWPNPVSADILQGKVEGTHLEHPY